MIVNVQLVDMNIDGCAVNGNNQMQSMLVLIVEQVEATR